MTNGEAVVVADRIVLAVCEIPDRNSPDDQPEMMLVTPEELRAIVCAALVEVSGTRPCPSCHGRVENVRTEPDECEKCGGSGVNPGPDDSKRLDWLESHIENLSRTRSVQLSDLIPIAGWFAEENRRELARLIAEHKVRTVVEVGSFLGLSAVWFAQQPGVEHVYCVDTWFELATHESENNLVGTLQRWGLPRDFFPVFRDNIMRSGVWHKITPIKGHSHYVHGEVPIVDLVYIDAGHEYKQVKRDIEIYRDKARVCLCGDDYAIRYEADGETPCFGVIEAVNELLPDAQHIGNFWWWMRQ